jgi:LuxR family maltose regulon positive regulatory protein
MTFSLLKTKLFMPRMRPGALVRPRLLAQLLTGVHTKLILVSAPAGFGKTTLMAQWKDALGGRALLGWVALDENDQDPVRFWTYVLAALDGARPGMAGEAAGLLRSTPPAPTETMLLALVNALADVSDDVFLILDDYHLIRSEEVHRGVRYLLDHLPPYLHLVLLTRTDPPLPLARFRARGDLLEIRAHDLRFQSEEAAALFGSLPGVRLSAEETAALADRTEGWVAGLQLAALSLQGREDAKGFIDAFVTGHHYLVDYLVEEVLYRQTEEIQRFLLRTSVLERLSGPLCEEVAGISGGLALLETLEQRGLFTIALDPERQWFRYHRLFADILRTHLQHLDPDLFLESNRKAAVWLQEHGMRAEAVRAALAARDFVRAADFIEAGADLFWQEGQVETLRSLLGLLPAAVLAERPVLLLQRARITLLIDADVPLGEGDLERAREALARSVLTATDEGRKIDAQIATLEALVARARGSVDRAVSLCRCALAALPNDAGLWWPLAASIYALACQETGDLGATLPTLKEAIVRSLRAHDLFMAVLQSSVQGDMELAMGLLHQAHDTYRQAILLGGEQGSPVRSVGWAYAGLGVVLYEWNRVDEARRHMEHARRLGEVYGHFDTDWRASKALTNFYQAQGELGLVRANKVLTWLASAQNFNPGSRAAATAQLAYQALLEGNLAEAIRLCEQVGTQLENGLGATWPESLVPARVMLARGRHSEAVELLRRRLALVEAAQEVDAQIRTLVLLAVALAAAGERGGAVDAVKQALALGRKERYVRAFLDEGPVMLGLLQAARADGMAPEYVEEILTSAGGGIGALGGVQVAPTVVEPAGVAGARLTVQPLAEPLTERELEILRMAATGMSNQEIGARVFIAAGTVKNHLHSIIGKLGVANRLQAINRARDLGLM